MKLIVDSTPLYSSGQGQPQHSCLQAPLRRGSCGAQACSCAAGCACMLPLKSRAQAAPCKSQHMQSPVSHQVQVASFLYHFSKAHMMHPLPYSMQDTNLWERPHLQPVDMGCLFQSLSVVAERAWITCSPVDDLRPSCHRFQIVHRRACHARPICKNRQALKQAAPGHL